MASGDVSTLDEASLDQFRIDLIKAGFEPVPFDFGWRWRGPIADSLKALTGSPHMDILILDGWPFRPPKLLIPSTDITSEHVSAEGEICLWRDDDATGQWMTFGGFQARIVEWCVQRAAGFRPEDAMLDAHLYFGGATAGVATLDIAKLNVDRRDPAGATNRIFGQWNKAGTVLALSPQRPKEGAVLHGRWYYHARVITAPPRDLDAFRAALTPGQAKNFARRLAEVEATGKTQTSVLLWSTPHGTNGLVLQLKRDDCGGVQGQALELAPSDVATLMLRSGPDVNLLRDKCVVLFGAGSIGSHVALLLAEAGLGKLRIVDADIMRPGNAVRHASVFATGDRKGHATALRVRISAPWTECEAINETPWAPSRVVDLIEDADLVIDATGLARFTSLIGRLAERQNKSLVSAALYRGGAVARVRRQVPGRDVPVHDRTDVTRYPVIPPGDEPLALEPGCNAPVNSASPIAVASIGALAAEIVIDTLAEGDRYSEDTVEVYRALDSAPFNRVGRLSHA